MFHCHWAMDSVTTGLLQEFTVSSNQVQINQNEAVKTNKPNPA